MSNLQPGEKLKSRRVEADKSEFDLTAILEEVLTSSDNMDDAVEALFERAQTDRRIVQSLASPSLRALCRHALYTFNATRQILLRYTSRNFSAADLKVKVTETKSAKSKVESMALHHYNHSAKYTRLNALAEESDWLNTYYNGVRLGAMKPSDIHDWIRRSAGDLNTRINEHRWKKMIQRRVIKGTVEDCLSNKDIVEMRMQLNLSGWPS